MSIRKQAYMIHHRVEYYVAIKMNEVYLCVNKKNCLLCNIKLKKSILSYAYVYYLLWL